MKYGCISTDPVFGHVRFATHMILIINIRPRPGSTLIVGGIAVNFLAYRLIYKTKI